jgi:hypothetical protein
MQQLTTALMMSDIARSMTLLARSRCRCAAGTGAITNFAAKREDQGGLSGACPRFVTKLCAKAIQGRIWRALGEHAPHLLVAALAGLETTHPPESTQCRGRLRPDCRSLFT